MALTKAQIRNKASQHLGDIAGTVGESDLDAGIDRVWRFEIPDQVPGTAREGSIDLTLDINEDTYDLDTHATLKGRVMAVRRGMRVGTTFLNFYTDPSAFWRIYDESDTATGTPSSVLVYGREIVFRPTPSAASTVYMPCALYREAMATGGVEYDPEGIACAAGAAMQIANERREHEVAADAGAAYSARIRELSARSLARPRARVMRRSW